MNFKDLLKNALFLVCLLLSQVCVSQQTSTDPPPPKRAKRTLGTVTNNTGGHGDDNAYCLDDNNKFQITFEVRLANLMLETEDGFPYGTIPNTNPKMYFQIEYNEILLEPILLDKFGFYQDPDGIDHYRIFIDSPILDFNDICPEEKNETFKFKMEGSLLTKVDNVWEPYPACNYLDSMFPCDLYPGGWCGEEYATGNEYFDVCRNDDFKSIYHHILMCNCDILKLENDDISALGFIDDKGDIEEVPFIDDNDGSTILRSEQDIEFSAYPNPVFNILNIDHGSIKSISIYNTLGILNYSAEINELATTTAIDLHSYPSGVYFIKVENRSDYRIIKVVKN